VPRFILRVVGAAGARGNSPAVSGFRQSARQTVGWSQHHAVRQGAKQSEQRSPADGGM